MDPWYKSVELRREVREGRSFNPDEFAIALEQVVAGTAPDDYSDPTRFFERTCFTRALREHAGMVLRRLSGKTENTAPVLTLITQFGGGKTHTLTALYHLAKAGRDAVRLPGVSELLASAGLAESPTVKVAVFVGNAWDPQEGKETPWIDVARQLAGSDGVEALGKASLTTPPGTEALAKIFERAGGTVLVLFDEVLNFISRHRRSFAEPFHAFLQNLTVAMTGHPRGAAIVSLPRSQVEMTASDQEWQEKITKVVRRVAKDLIANDEAEIGEVVRRRLFENLGSEKVRANVVRAYADWCFERRAQLPPQWIAVDTSATEKKAREVLASRFEACYPFHPATLSVFQRKWQALPQYQQTRGTLAMLAQWVSLGQHEAMRHARQEPLITLGSAPLDAPDFRSAVLGQLGEARLTAAIDADIAGENAHARALDGDTKGQLKSIHRRVGTAILFESSGGQVDKVAHLPELRFALGEPGMDTTSIDNAATALESRSFFLRRVGTDGFQIRHQPTLKKVVNDRRASLDQDSEVLPTMKALVLAEFRRRPSDKAKGEGDAPQPVICDFPRDSSDIDNTPKLTLVIVDPTDEWDGAGPQRDQMLEWTARRGQSPRECPAAIVWCLKKPGRELREKVEMLLAWRRVQAEIASGVLGTDFDRAERADIHATVRDAETAASEEVWASYRFAVLSDATESTGLRTIDLGQGHSSGTETMAARVIGAMRSEALLNVSVGAAYLERNWPPALETTGAWPLASLRQAFLSGALTRLVDPDKVLRAKVPEFVANGELGLASSPRADGTYDRVWFGEPLPAEEMVFEKGVFLLKRATASALKRGDAPPARKEVIDLPLDQERETSEQSTALPTAGASEKTTVSIQGQVAPEVWNRLGSKILPKLRGAGEVEVNVGFAVRVSSELAPALRSELRQILDELGLTGVRLE